MIIDETHVQEWVQDLTIIGWTVIEEEQLTKANLGTKETQDWNWYHSTTCSSSEKVQCNNKKGPQFIAFHKWGY
jgi:hypothetical protein